MTHIETEYGKAHHENMEIHLGDLLRDYPREYWFCNC